MKILLVDDHPVVRQGIRLMLAADPELDVCAEAINAASAIEILRRTEMPFDLMILDLNLPDQNGFVVLQESTRHRPEMAVLIMSIQPEEHMAVRALKLGASGYLSKEAAPDELIKAITTLRRGKKYISPALAEWLALDVSGHREGLPHERLSEREYQVFCLLSAGKSISDIAESLSRSPTTISTYRSRILRKMGIDTNAGLTQYALQHALIR
jgi:two-component system invasion response regulator UvrY